MWHFVLLAVCGCVLSVSARAQIPVSARLLGMGGAGTASGEYAGDMLSNPAGITGNVRSAVLLAHQYRYHQPDVSSQLALVVLPFRIAQMGLVVVHFGLESAYQHTSLGYVFGKRFGPDLALAWGVRYRHLRIPGYVDESGVDMDIGFQYRVSPMWRIGGSVKSLSLVPFVDTGDRRDPPEGRIGMAYRLGEGLDVVTDLHYHREVGADLRIGMDYAFVPSLLHLRLGLSTSDPPSTFAGIGLDWKNFRFDAGSVFHRQLGMSPQIDVSYVFRKE